MIIGNLKQTPPPAKRDPVDIVRKATERQRRMREAAEKGKPVYKDETGRKWHTAAHAQQPGVSPQDQIYSTILEKMYTRIMTGEMGRGWLVGWRDNPSRGTRGILDYVGFGTEVTALKYIRLYGMPVHRLPDKRPRAIPWELDMWLIRFCQLLEETANDRKMGMATGYDNGFDTASSRTRGTAAN